MMQTYFNADTLSPTLLFLDKISFTLSAFDYEFSWHAQVSILTHARPSQLALVSG